jgi:hypothetical protein
MRRYTFVLNGKAFFAFDRLKRNERDKLMRSPRL